MPSNSHVQWIFPPSNSCSCLCTSQRRIRTTSPRLAYDSAPDWPRRGCCWLKEVVSTSRASNSLQNFKTSSSHPFSLIFPANNAIFFSARLAQLSPEGDLLSAIAIFYQQVPTAVRAHCLDPALLFIVGIPTLDALQVLVHLHAAGWQNFEPLLLCQRAHVDKQEPCEAKKFPGHQGDHWQVAKSQWGHLSFQSILGKVCNSCYFGVRMILSEP